MTPSQENYIETLIPETMTGHRNWPPNLHETQAPLAPGGKEPPNGTFPLTTQICLGMLTTLGNTGQKCRNWTIGSTNAYAVVCLARQYALPLPTLYMSSLWDDRQRRSFKDRKMPPQVHAQRQVVLQRNHISGIPGHAPYSPTSTNTSSTQTSHGKTSSQRPRAR